MANNSRAIYLRAVQSQRIEIKGPQQRTFLVPAELILNRSRFVRNAVHWPQQDGAHAYIDFSETPISTLEEFIVWIYAAEPTITASAGLEALIELAIFAEIHDFEVLHNQTLDILRGKLGKKEWTLNPQVVERVYGAIHSETPLRRLFRFLLTTAQKQTRYHSDVRQAMSSWSNVFLALPEAGRDYFIATCEEYSANNIVSGGPCRFHWHRDPSGRNTTNLEEAYCPLARDGCFAHWGTYSVLEDAGREMRGPDVAKLSKKERKKLQKAKLALLTSGNVEPVVMAEAPPEAQESPEAPEAETEAPVPIEEQEDFHF